MLGPHIIFAPNTTGRITVPNAAVFWLSYLRAKERNLTLLIRYDNFPSAETYPGWQKSPSGVPDSVLESVTSFREMRELLGVSHDTTKPAYAGADVSVVMVEVFQTHRILRYLEVLDMLLAGGLVERRGGSYFLTKPAEPVGITWGWRFRPEYMSLVDFADYAVLDMVRGRDIRDLEPLEWRLHKTLCKVLGPFPMPKYEYLPVFYQDMHAHYKIDKQSNMPAECFFAEWARLFDNPRDCHEALESLIFEDGQLTDAEAIVYGGDGYYERLKTRAEAKTRKLYLRAWEG